MRAKDFITELGNNPYPIPKRWSNADIGKRTMSVQLPSGNTLSIAIETEQNMGMDSGSMAVLNFYVNGSQDITGSGDAFKIFSTVGAALADYVKKNKPLIIAFSGSEGDPSRIKLYDTIAAKLSRLPELSQYENITDEPDIWPEELEWMLDDMGNSFGQKVYVFAGPRFWKGMMEAEEEPKVIKLRGFGPSEKTKEWVANVKAKFYNEGNNSYIFWNHEGNIIPLGKEETKDIAAYVQFELVPKENNRVEIKWIQATPLRGGYGAKGMKMLQDLAQQSGIKLTLYAWDKGTVSQPKLMKFYKKQGFNQKGGTGNMEWEPSN